MHACAHKHIHTPTSLKTHLCMWSNAFSHTLNLSNALEKIYMCIYIYICVYIYIIEAKRKEKRGQNQPNTLEKMSVCMDAYACKHTHKGQIYIYIYIYIYTKKSIYIDQMPSQIINSNGTFTYTNLKSNKIKTTYQKNLYCKKNINLPI